MAVQWFYRPNNQLPPGASDSPFYAFATLCETFFVPLRARYHESWIDEILWDKSAVSSRELENQRAETLKTLDGFLKGLGYSEEVP